jgi:hypothetical protein
MVRPLEHGELVLLSSVRKAEREHLPKVSLHSQLQIATFDVMTVSFGAVAATHRGNPLVLPIDDLNLCHWDLRNHRLWVFYPRRQNALPLPSPCGLARRWGDRAEILGAQGDALLKEL